jgi:azurin
MAKARFDGKTCTWSSADGGSVIVLDTHPAVYMDYLAPKVGKDANGNVTKRIAVPGTKKALVETHSFALTHRHQKDLLALYAAGVVQVSMDYTGALSDARVIAVLRLFTSG